MQEISFENTGTAILKKYENQKEDFHIVPQGNSNIKLGIVLKNCDVSFLFEAIYENTLIECYFLVPAINNQDVKLNIQTNFKAKNTKIIINVIALSNDNTSIALNGNLHIENNISNVEARLYEEALLLGKAKYISLIPGLRVDSPDVVASHGAKIQRISSERIFYMQSRGLSEEKAINMIVDSYSQDIAQKLQLNESEKSEFYSIIK